MYIEFPCYLSIQSILASELLDYYEKKVFEKRSGINIVLVMLYGFKIDLLLFVLCNVDLTYPPGFAFYPDDISIILVKRFRGSWDISSPADF